MNHAGIPGWRPGFAVTAAGSGSTNPSSRSARHRSPGLPERHRACRASESARYVGGMVGGHTGLPTRCRRVARTRRASATQARRDPQGSQSTTRLTARCAGRLPRPSFDAFQTWWSRAGDSSGHEPGSPPRFPGVRRRLIGLHLGRSVLHDVVNDLESERDQRLGFLFRMDPSPSTRCGTARSLAYALIDGSLMPTIGVIESGSGSSSPKRPSRSSPLGTPVTSQRHLHTYHS
jgi:hypothetical protein